MRIHVKARCAAVNIQRINIIQGVKKESRCYILKIKKFLHLINIRYKKIIAQIMLTKKRVLPFFSSV